MPIRRPIEFTRRQFGLALAGITATRFACGAESNVVDSLMNQIPQWMAQADVPGCSVAWISNARVAWSQGFGLKIAGTDERVDDETVFESASLTKPVTAYLALQLVEAGKIDVDAPLAPVVEGPITEEDPERLNRITARHVLTHSSGFPNWRPRGKALRVRFEPGERYSYSGEGFVLLSRAIEAVTGESFEDYAKRSIFDPFQLESASLVWRDDYATRLAGGHDPRRNINGARVKRREPNAAASLVCTARDYAEFVCTLLSPPAQDAFHLGADTIDEMLSPQIRVNDDIDWGLGWGLQKDASSFWHWGNQNEVYHNFVLANRVTGSGIVVFTNGRQGRKVYGPAVRTAMSEDQPSLRRVRA